MRWRAIFLLVGLLAIGGCRVGGAPRPQTAKEGNSFGGFESGLTPWGALNNTSLSLTTDVHRFGHAAAKVTAQGVGEYGIYAPNARAKPARGSIYRLSVWVAGAPQTIGPPVTIQLTEDGGPSPLRLMAQRVVRLQRSWRQVTLSGTVTGRHRTGIQIYVSQSRDIAPGDTFFIDNVVLSRP